MLPVILCLLAQMFPFPGPGSSGGGGSSYDTDAQAYFTGIVANGGTISTASKGYVNTFFLAAKSHSYYSKLVIFSCIVGDQLAAALEQYQPGVGASAMTTSTFVGGDYTEATGLTGDGSTKYADTGYNPLTAGLSATSAGFWVYVVPVTELSKHYFGAMTGGAGNRTYLDTNTASGWASTSTMTDVSNPSTGSVATLSGNYLFGMNTNGSTTLHTYANGSIAENSSGLADSTFASNTIWLCATDFGGSAYQPTSSPIRFFAITTGLSSTDITNLYNDVLAFETSLSRN